MHELDDYIRNITGILWLELEAYHKRSRPDHPACLALNQMDGHEWWEHSYCFNFYVQKAIQHRMNAGFTFNCWDYASQAYLIWRSKLKNPANANIGQPELMRKWREFNISIEVRNSIKVLEQCALSDKHFKACLQGGGSLVNNAKKALLCSFYEDCQSVVNIKNQQKDFCEIDLEDGFDSLIGPLPVEMSDKYTPLLPPEVERKWTEANIHFGIYPERSAGGLFMLPEFEGSGELNDFFPEG